MDGRYHLGHNRRRIGAGFAHERKKGRKKKATSLARRLRREAPKIWARVANSSNYTKLSVKDMFPNRTLYKQTVHHVKRAKKKAMAKKKAKKLTKKYKKMRKALLKPTVAAAKITKKYRA